MADCSCSPARYAVRSLRSHDVPRACAIYTRKTRILYQKTLPTHLLSPKLLFLFPAFHCVANSRRRSVSIPVNKDKIFTTAQRRECAARGECATPGRLPKSRVIPYKTRCFVGLIRRAIAELSVVPDDEWCSLKDGAVCWQPLWEHGLLWLHACYSR